MSLKKVSPFILGTRWWSLSFLILAVSLFIGPRPVAADPDNVQDTADWILVPIADVDGFFPTPWGGGPGCEVAPSPPQSMLQFHQNWHCSNRDGDGPNWGNRFFGFHKQFLLGYNRFLAARGEANVKTWVAGPDVEIPPTHSGRPAKAKCTFCAELPTTFLVPSVQGTLDSFGTVDEIGNAIVGWHNENHGNIASAGGTGGCGGGDADMGCFEFSPRDPIFYRYHHIFDDVQDAWRTLQPTDIAIVLDRSGSMALPTSSGSTRLDAAKQAVALFADLLEGNKNHKLGIVSFSTTASDPPDMPLTSVPVAPAAISAALSGIVADGSTSIGDGLKKAQDLVSKGSEGRKAILLLTDGMENTDPSIATVVPYLGDTHVCSIGFGTPGTVEGPKLRDLSERQGGIFITTPDELELKKFFVMCFANIFDTFPGADPIDTLPAGQSVSTPTVHRAFLDEKIVFVLGWTHPAPPRSLMLAITTPLGNVLSLDAPGVESKFGPTWHIVRFNTPYQGERDGNWTARVVRPIRTYVNGFSSRSFNDFEQGVSLVRTQLANLCTTGCHNILYYEDATTSRGIFREHNTIYTVALRSQPRLGRITRPANASEFRKALEGGYSGEGTFDLLVYSSQYDQGEQPYDHALVNVLCSNRTRAIVSDNRHTKGAQDILRCAGAIRGNQTNFKTIVSSDSSALLDRPATFRVPDGVPNFSYEVLPVNGSVSQARSTTDAVAVVVQAEQGQSDERYFITVLTRSATKLKPFNYRNNTYTLEDLHPTFHIPDMYWPKCGFDKVTAVVNVTRPLSSLAKLLGSVKPMNGSTVQGDKLSPRAAAAQAVAKGVVIPTETKQFTLYDDGTHGDSTANDHYWEVSLPPDFTAVDGDYHLHAFFRLCKTENCGRQNCIDREAQQSITVRAQASSGSKVTVKKVSDYGDRCRSRVLVTPVDKNGTLLGPGLVDELLITTVGDVKVESTSDHDGSGTYEIVVNWSNKTNHTEVIIAQFGRPANAIHLKL